MSVYLSNGEEVSLELLSPTIVSLIQNGDITELPDFLSTCTVATGPSLEDKCAICLGALTDEPSLHNPKCSHVLHENCMPIVLSSFNRCPFCRVPWDSEREERLWAKMTQQSLRSLQHDERMNLDLPSLPQFEDRIGDVLAGTVRSLAWAMQQDFPCKRSPLDGNPTSAPIFQEQSQMRWAANSKQGQVLIQYLLRSISQVTAADLRACDTLPDEGEGMNVHWCVGLDDDVLLRQEHEPAEKEEVVDWQTDFLKGKFWDASDRRVVLEDAGDGYVDVWLMAGSLVLDTVMDLTEGEGVDQMSLSLVRFLEKIAVWSLKGCLKKLREMDAAAAAE